MRRDFVIATMVLVANRQALEIYKKKRPANLSIVERLSGFWCCKDREILGIIQILADEINFFLTKSIVTIFLLVNDINHFNLLIASTILGFNTLLTNSLYEICL